MTRMNTSKSVNMLSGGVLRFSLMVSLIFTSLLSFAQKDTPLNPGVQQGLYLLETEQTRKALTELEQVVTANPLDASLLYYLGYAQIKVGERAKALASFEKGVKINEKEPLSYVGLGYINLLEKKSADAKLQFDKALAMTRSKNVAVLKGIAEAYLVDNKYSVDALGLLNKAKSVNDADPGVQILLGDTYLIQNSGGNAGPALSAYENAVAIKLTDANAKSHSDGKAQYKIGLVYQKTRNNEVAQESFIKAITADPNYTPAYKELGEIYYLNKESDKAVKAYEKYLSLTENPENPQYQYQYAFFLFMTKDYKKANEVFSKIADAKNVTTTTLRFYAVSLFEDGDFKKSREISERYFAKVKPEDIAANDYVYYGKSLLKLKFDSLGAINLQKSIALDKDQPEILQLIGDTYFKLKKFPKAIDAYKQLMRQRKTPLAQDNFSIGRAYYYNNQLIQADSSFSKLIEMKPDMTVGYLWEARTKANMDTTSELGLAKPYFEKLIEKASVNPEKNKNDLVDSYHYLGYYYYLKKDYAAAKTAYEKLLALKPDDGPAKEALPTLKKLLEKK